MAKEQVTDYAKAIRTGPTLTQDQQHRLENASKGLAEAVTIYEQGEQAGSLILGMAVAEMNDLGLGSSDMSRVLYQQGNTKYMRVNTQGALKAYPQILNRTLQVVKATEWPDIPNMGKTWESVLEKRPITSAYSVLQNHRKAIKEAATPADNTAPKTPAEKRVKTIVTWINNTKGKVILSLVHCLDVQRAAEARVKHFLGATEAPVPEQDRDQEREQELHLIEA